MSEAKPAPIDVKHNPAESRFEAVVEGHLSVCDYQREDSRMVFTHTYVPSALRGRGIAEKLVRTALDFARQEKLTVVPACSYVAVFIDRHAEFKPLLAR